MDSEGAAEPETNGLCAGVWVGCLSCGKSAAGDFFGTCGASMHPPAILTPFGFGRPEGTVAVFWRCFDGAGLCTVYSKCQR